MGIKRLLKQVLTEKNNQRYKKELASHKQTYHQWVTGRETELAAEWGDLKACADAVQSHTELPFLCLVSCEGCLAEDAFGHLEAWFQNHPEIMIAYGDEDVWKPGEPERRFPWFKPDWSPQLLESQFYLGNMVAVRRSLYDKAMASQGLPPYGHNAGDKASSVQEGPDCNIIVMEEREKYQKLIRLCIQELGRAAGQGGGERRRAIRHLPEILFHCNSKESMMSIMENSRGKAWGPVMPQGRAASLSVIIPSKDHPELLKRCLTSLSHALCGIPSEIIVVDNGSSYENRRRTEEMLGQVTADAEGRGVEKVNYLYSPMEFHFSRMCNLGAKKTIKKHLLFLNDDVELCCQESLEKMIELSDRQDVGAVGLKLYYPGSTRIQHAGITNLPMGPVHKLQFLDDRETYYLGWNRGTRNVLAVTGACLMVERRKFQEAGGFPEELRVAFNDVDLCFTLYEKGYENVCVCDSYAYHYESLSRGDDESAGKLERLLSERKKLYERHPGLAGRDPYYSVFLNRQGLDTHIRPEYETAGNRVQELRTCPDMWDMRQLMGYREDACLMVRVEAEEPFLIGWGVVLGDNNACYEKDLLLKQEPREGSEKAWGAIYHVPLRGQYRPDLEENMPDQVNVALSGYQVLLKQGTLPTGNYLVGMAARSLMNGTRILNWSNRRIKVV